MPPKNTQSTANSSRWLFLPGTAVLIIILLSILLPRSKDLPAKTQLSNSPALSSSIPSRQPERVNQIVHRHASNASTNATAEQIVAAKLTQFAHNRLELARKMSAHSNVAITPDIAQFFAAVEAGNWQG